MSDLLTIASRINYYRDFKKYKKSEFERLCGLSNGYLNNISKPGPDILENILNACNDLSRNWILTGQGEMLKEESGNPNENISISIKAGSKSENIKEYYQLNELITVEDSSSCKNCKKLEGKIESLKEQLSERNEKIDMLNQELGRFKQYPLDAKNDDVRCG